METPSSLSPATPADLPEVAALMNRAYRAGGAQAGWCSEAGMIEGPRTSAALLAADLERRPDGALLILREQGAILASVWLEPWREDGWTLGGLSVEPAHQDGGLGRRVLEAAESWAGARGARSMRLTVVSGRDSLLAWYERRGYRRTGGREAWPADDTRFGRPLQPGLAFLELQKTFA